MAGAMESMFSHHGDGKEGRRVIMDTDKDIDHPIATVCVERSIDRGGSTASGCAFVPDFYRGWRRVGPSTKDFSPYDVGVDETFAESQLRSLAQQGDIITRQSGGLYPALQNLQEREMRNYADQLEFAHEHNALFPAQYPAIVDILNRGVRAVYSRGVGVTPRIRGLPYNRSAPDQTLSIASKLWKDVHARRMFACSTATVTDETPIDATPTTTVEKKNPDPTIGTDRRAIADMRRVNVGFSSTQYYPVRVPSVESIARLLVAMTTPPRLGYPDGKKGNCCRIPTSQATTRTVTTNVYGVSRMFPWALS